MVKTKYTVKMQFVRTVPRIKMLYIGTVPTTKIQPIMTVCTVITYLVVLYLQDMKVNDASFSFNLQGQDLYTGEIMYMYTYLSQADKSIKGGHQGYNIIIFLGSVTSHDHSRAKF